MQRKVVIDVDINYVFSFSFANNQNSVKSMKMSIFGFLPYQNENDDYFISLNRLESICFSWPK